MGVLVSHCVPSQFPSWGEALLQDTPAISCLQSREEALVGSDSLILRRNVGAEGWSRKEAAQLSSCWKLSLGVLHQECDLITEIPSWLPLHLTTF